MRKFFVSLIIFLFTFSNVNAIRIVVNSSNNKSVITLEDLFIYFGNLYNDKIPDSYKYINVKYKNIKNKKLYESLQKLIYVNKIPNIEGKLNFSKNVSLYNLYNFLNKNYNQKLKITDIEKAKNTLIYKNNLSSILKNLTLKEYNLDFETENYNLKLKKEIFKDVYNTLNTQTYYKDDIEQVKMWNKAIEGLAKGTGDKFTVYFPPTTSKNFKDSLSGKYEGIGSYVDMEKPGELKIVSPMPDSPAEKAGLKGGDIVIKVDGKEITEDNNISEVISWIKGPAGTKVKLTIKRGKKIFDVEVKRAEIILKEVEIKKVKYDTYLIKLKFFGDNIALEFKNALEKIEKEKGIKKIIFDLRGNGGGYLDQVAQMLSYFVPRGEKTVITKYYSYETAYYSKGYDLIDFSKYKLIFLENGGTASASEIFIGTIKDYYPKSIIIGEKSYGKGSVQTIKTYKDNSALKYTIAKWFTGKNHIGIDQIGIKPDIEIKMERYGVEENKDLQLKKALKLR